MIAAALAMTRTDILMLAVSVVLLASLVQQSTARSLLQTGSTCSGAIPECEAGRCYLQTVSGKMQNVCERCKPGYNTTTDGLSCVCMPGLWHSCTAGVCTCKPCDRAMFCPGGWREAKNYADDNLKGLRHSCKKAQVVPEGSPITTLSIQTEGLTTKSNRSTRPQDCVPMPGFYLNATSRATQEAALCPTNTYSPGYGRIRQCLRCQSGTEEDLSDGYSNSLPAAKLRKNRLEVCEVPPGRYLVQNVVRDCPAGSFRKVYSLTTESNSRYCFTCPPGVTTNGTKATSEKDCKIVVPGVLMTASNLTQAQTVALSGDPALGDTAVTLCPYGTYFPGGVLDTSVSTASTCLQCPYGTTTQFLGSTSINDCQIPPGYYIQTTGSGSTMTGSLTACPTNVTGQGYYRSGWTSYNDVKAQSADGTTACTPCGPGILSALTDIDEKEGGNDTSKLVAGSSYSCYIQAGWGMVPTGVVLADNTMQFAATLCANNTYGVANTTYGLQSTPCKPCQRNLITLQEGSTNYTQCVNPAGFGYSPNGATACPPGSYAPVGSMQGCVQCPSGRTTDSDPAKQTAITDCYVIPGYGVFLGNTTDTNGPWGFSTNSLTNLEKAQLPVLPCPVGRFGVGGALDSKCEACTAGTSTQGTMATASTDCSVCAAGYGIQGTATACTQCAAGTYQPGYLGNEAGSGQNFGAGISCLNCPTTLSVYISSRGNETEFVSPGTTYRVGAAGRDECVPKTAQLGIDIGTVMFNDTTLLTASTTTATTADPAACMNTATICPAGQCCFVQFDYAFRKGTGGTQGPKTCYYVNMSPNNNKAAHTDSANKLLYYKMLPSDAIAAASLKAKAMSSGLYARCDLPTSGAWATVDAGKIGKPLGTAMAAGTDAGLAACKKQCDMMSTCWGFTVISSLCQLRGGYDEQDVRTFFRNPEPATGYSW